MCTIVAALTCLGCLACSMDALRANSNGADVVATLDKTHSHVTVEHFRSKDPIKSLALLLLITHPTSSFSSPPWLLRTAGCSQLSRQSPCAAAKFDSNPHTGQDGSKWRSDKFYTHSGYGYSRPLCDDVVSWFVQEHLAPYRVNLEIVHSGLKRQEALGLCQVSDDGNCYRPRDFRITVQSGLSQDDYVSTLLHELWHVKQMMVGELRLLVREQYWQDTPIENTSSEGHELQAEKMESALAKEFWLSRKS